MLSQALSLKSDKSLHISPCVIGREQLFKFLEVISPIATFKISGPKNYSFEQLKVVCQCIIKQDHKAAQSKMNKAQKAALSSLESLVITTKDYKEFKVFTTFIQARINPAKQVNSDCLSSQSEECILHSWFTNPEQFLSMESEQ